MSIFTDMADVSQIRYKDMPMTSLYGADELCIANPYSLATCYFLYLYSLELGSPPLYLELDVSSRMMEMNNLESLGPFARVFSEIMTSGDKRRHDSDKIKPGMQSCITESGGSKHNMEGMFMLYSGAMMQESQLTTYEQNNFFNVGKECHLLGNPSFTEDVRVALRHAVENPKADHKPVMFAISCQNYRSP